MIDAELTRTNNLSVFLKTPVIRELGYRVRNRIFSKASHPKNPFKSLHAF